MRKPIIFSFLLSAFLLLPGCNKETVDNSSSTVSQPLINAILYDEEIPKQATEEVYSSLNYFSEIVKKSLPEISSETVYITVSEENGRGLLIVEDLTLNAIPFIFQYTYDNKELTSINILFRNFNLYPDSSTGVDAEDVKEREMNLIG